ncbi:unnamed protein product [Ceratitis capitata]|uniref:(Mediterranean fruit fly) hypothetical protein n=1 Tax=Ceratitis capitata TaxID=7213 RepID=A0A811U185_CERCA|nr:unnamed protein product [Ceratitis capitata]
MAKSKVQRKKVQKKIKQQQQLHSGQLCTHWRCNVGDKLDWRTNLDVTHEPTTEQTATVDQQQAAGESQPNKRRMVFCGEYIEWVGSMYTDDRMP